MNSYWSVLRTRFAMSIVAMSLLALIASANAEAAPPANPPAWNATTLYDRAGLYVRHKDKVWVSEWAITWGAEPGANRWNGWKNGAALSKDAAKPTPWDAESLYDGAGFYVSHRGKVWMSRWYITRGQEPGANTWNGWKPVRSLRWAGVFSSTYRSFAINEQGELYGWGNNYAGRLGDGTTTSRNSPTRIRNRSDWKDFSAGTRHILAITTKGELYAWGSNYAGKLGDGTTTDRDSPTRIGTASDWAYISAGSNHSLAINTKGELYAWGRNYCGQLGDGTTTDRDSPTRIGAAADWKNVSGRGPHSLAINTKGELYAWGCNGNGQLGDGTNTDQSSPVKIVAHP